MLPRVLATRYVSPLREGGSLPGLVEADDLGTYVMKFTGAGQGRKALVAEVVVGELGRRLGLRIPELVAIELDASIGHYEADQEVQDLLTASVGLNLGIDFLPGAFGFDGVASPADPAEAARILWLDAFVTNVDRTWRSPNLSSGTAGCGASTTAPPCISTTPGSGPVPSGSRPSPSTPGTTC